MLVLVAPEKKYVNGLLEKTSCIDEKSIADVKLYKSNIKGHEFLIVITGYGKVNIARSLQYIYDNYKISVILQIGTMGSINNYNDILSSVIPNNVLQFDIDFIPLGKAPACIPLMNKGIYKTNEDLVDCMKKACSLSNVTYSNDLIASGDMFVCNNNLSSSIRKEYMAGGVDCESGVIGQFAYINNIPFVVMKVISNFAYNNAIRQYNLYDNEACSVSQRIAYKFLEQYYE